MQQPCVMIKPSKCQCVMHRDQGPDDSANLPAGFSNLAYVWNQSYLAKAGASIPPRSLQKYYINASSQVLPSEDMLHWLQELAVCQDGLKYLETNFLSRSCRALLSACQFDADQSKSQSMSVIIYDAILCYTDSWNMLQAALYTSVRSLQVSVLHLYLFRSTPLNSGFSGVFSCPTPTFF